MVHIYGRYYLVSLWGLDAKKQDDYSMSYVYKSGLCADANNGNKFPASTKLRLIMRHIGV